MIRVKPGVSLDNTHEAIWTAVAVAARVWSSWEADLWVTSANDGVHPGGARPSFHPKGQAVDVRTHNLPVNGRQQAIDMLRGILGPNYDVLYESVGTPNEHCHIQYDPQGE